MEKPKLIESQVDRTDVTGHPWAATPGLRESARGRGIVEIAMLRHSGVTVPLNIRPCSQCDDTICVAFVPGNRIYADSIRITEEGEIAFIPHACIGEEEP